MRKPWKLGIGCVLLAVLVAYVTGCDMLGAGRMGTKPLDPGPYAPAMDEGPLSRDIPHGPTQRGQAILAEYAAQVMPDWKTQGKVSAPRIALAKLALGQDIEAVNAHFQSVTPWSRSGSTWTMHKGDYDFTEVTLTEILYLFGDRPDRLYPETVAYMLDKLLVEEGGKPRIKVPFSLGLVTDTENHHLMTEGSRYLKNQWLFEKGNAGQKGNPAYDNAVNGLEAWLVGYLEEMRDEGVYEFNSIPYLGYTVQALLNLDAFARSPEVSRLARHLLDTMNWQYALGSHNFRRCAPFRRQALRAGETSLDADPHVDVMSLWTSPPYDPNGPEPPLGHRTNFGLIAELLPYRLPDAVRKWTLEKPLEYFTLFGRGPSGSPELYSGGPDYLISAGGLNRHMRSLIAARPTTLMLADGEMDYRRCFYIGGQGWWRRWNNTGVHRRFACGNVPVHVPEQYAPVATAGNWRLFAPESVPRLRIAVYSGEAFGLLALFVDWPSSPEVLLQAIREANPDPERIGRRFVWPGGNVIAYDVDAPKGSWVIESVNGKPVDRAYDAWPQFSGDMPRIAFARTETQ
ncbi:MAG: hypothetical protein QG656_2363 [Candidatus Hydrogenedentes bacterium]|nr:hypothetical protein [Candidatus Hydrogenedentota bacterium]